MTTLDEMQGKTSSFTIKTGGQDLDLTLRPYTLMDAISLGRMFNEGKIIRAFENLEMDVICDIVAFQLDSDSKAILDNVVLLPAWALGSKWRKALFYAVKPIRSIFTSKISAHSLKLQYLVMMNDAFFDMIGAITSNRAINSPEVIEGFNSKKKLKKTTTSMNAST